MTPATSAATEEPLESVPLSALNALVYCPRRYYYEYVLGEMEVNAHVMSGRYAHQRVDSGERTREEDGMMLRRLYVWSDRLHIHGYTDVVEADAAGRLHPVEYKRGRMGDWPGDQIQLCAHCASKSGPGRPSTPETSTTSGRASIASSCSRRTCAPRPKKRSPRPSR